MLHIKHIKNNNAEYLEVPLTGKSLLNTPQLNNETLAQQRFVVFGAGTAGMGVETTLSTLSIK